MKTVSHHTFAIALASLLGTGVVAQDDGLYAEPAPKDASFVRFIGLKPGAQVGFAGHHFRVPDEPQAYIAVSSALLNGINTGTFFTVIPQTQNKRVRIKEPPRSDRSKVHLFLVNGGSKPLKLMLADGETPVIESVAPGTAMSRAVNPVSASLAVFEENNNSALGSFEVTLRRGQNLSFVADGYSVRLIENRFGPVQK